MKYLILLLSNNSFETHTCIIKILIINDYSKDKTYEEILRATKNFDYSITVYNSTINLGYGGVQKYAFQYAIDNEFNYAIMVHGDGQYAPEEIPNFILKFDDESLDAVFGSRMISYKSALKLSLIHISEPTRPY